MELGRIGQVTGVERHLYVFDIVNVLLGILHELLNIDLLGNDDAADFVGKAFPARILVAHDTFDKISKGGLVLVVLEHAQSR
jgi:hypothetical protein